MLFYFGADEKLSLDNRIAEESSVLFYIWQNQTVNVKFFHGHWFDFLGTARAYSNTAKKSSKKETQRQNNPEKNILTLIHEIQSLTF